MNDPAVHQRITADWSDSLKELLPVESFQFFDSVSSTNDVLLERAEANPDITTQIHLAVADFQTSGRGRRGDAWLAPAGKNLLFSLLLPLELPQQVWPRLPQVIAWSMGRTIESVIDPYMKIQTKWPNDLYLEGKKLGGILVETSTRSSRSFAVVGMGVNVNVKAAEFPDEIREIATSLYEHIGCESNRWYLLGQFLKTFLTEFPEKTLCFDACLAWVQERDFLVHRNVRVKLIGNSEPLTEGRACGIGNEGELLVQTSSGQIEKVLSSERLSFS